MSCKLYDQVFAGYRLIPKVMYSPVDRRAAFFDIDGGKIVSSSVIDRNHAYVYHDSISIASNGRTATCLVHAYGHVWQANFTVYPSNGNITCVVTGDDGYEQTFD